MKSLPDNDKALLGQGAGFLESPENQAEASTLERATTYRRVCVVGLGYVGLPTALLFTRKGFTVHGADISETVVRRIREGRIAEAYPELAEWADTIRDNDRFRVDLKPAPSDVFLITVPTPVHPETRSCDLTAVKAAAEALVSVLARGNLVILESTVPPGTTRNVVKPILEKSGLKVGEDIHLCFCPERILPGNTIEELIRNHRVLGGVTPEAAMLAKTLLAQVIEGEIFITDDKSAEFCKLAENTYRDVNIALANELSLIADEHGIDLKAIIPIINQHPRVKLLTPGIGVGGHCIAVDPWFFVEVSPWRTELIRTSREVNDRMPAYCVQKITEDLKGIENPRICAVGLTYKPDVGDTRESPALRIVTLLRERGFDVVTYDPLLDEYQGQSLHEAVRGADYLAVLVSHSVIKAELSLNREKIRQAMRTPTIRIF
jgi:UDP-N-acetyl-D-mannosaminuronic acid dehydrogenase